MKKITRFLAGIVFAHILAAPVFSVAQTNASRAGVTVVPLARSGANTAMRASTTAARSGTTAPRATASARAGTTPRAVTPAVAARAASSALVPVSATMGGGYNACRDAYFTCMDQFCGTRDETMRRCVCSARLENLRAAQRTISQANSSLANFTDYNLDAINKSSAEVLATLTATAGESASYKTDSTAAAQKLAGVTSILNTNKRALATGGQLDAAGDISQIWASTDLISGSDISTLVGERLYSAVHEQCIQMATDACERQSTENMVVSAYAMYIEQDCNTVAAAIEGKRNTVAADVRAKNREMNVARVENYNAHNSADANQCITNIRADLFADTACGSDYVHCLDITGMYLNTLTGDPIYTPNFFRLGDQLSLDGDILRNPKNAAYVSALNSKKLYASRSLDTCRDTNDTVWDEFLRTAIVEIYQGQTQKILDVQNECVAVVNQCYDTQNARLRDFASATSQYAAAGAMEVTEQMCRDKLQTCANAFGGSEDGMTELIEFATNSATTTIMDNCAQMLREYSVRLCTDASDIAHNYPYACRTREMGNFTNYMAGGATNSMYAALAKYALENCSRPSTTKENMQTAVKMAVNAEFDHMRVEMNRVMTAECEKYYGEWTQQEDASPIPAFLSMIGDTDGWGTCAPIMCLVPNDAYMKNGVKECCDSKTKIANNDLTGCDEIATNTCQGTAGGDSNNPGTQADIDNTCSAASGDGVVGGCAKQYCRCASDMVTSGGKCAPTVTKECAYLPMIGMRFDTTCASSAFGPVYAGCAAQYCRCNSGYYATITGNNPRCVPVNCSLVNGTISKSCTTASSAGTAGGCTSALFCACSQSQKWNGTTCVSNVGGGGGITQPCIPNTGNGGLSTDHFGLVNWCTNDGLDQSVMQ